MCQRGLAQMGPRISGTFRTTPHATLKPLGDLTALCKRTTCHIGHSRIPALAPASTILTGIGTILTGLAATPIPRRMAL
jgi:hypothetical protein